MLPATSAAAGQRARHRQFGPGKPGSWPMSGRWRSGRLRALPREPEMVLPALVIPLFFFAVNIGTLQDFAETRHPRARLQGVPVADRDRLRGDR